MKKYAFVSGGTRGIGKGVADILRDNGYEVMISSSTVPENTDGYEYIKCDISNSADIARAVGYAEEKFGRIDLLVNCAGVGCKKRLDVLETTEESFERLMNINTKGTFFMCQAFANKMIEWKKLDGSLDRKSVV